ncbi:hypothetical protein AAF712_014599 [Marasmius tenuissimus]|uniref:JmjC domain-containing protein n=1 Tax=Marasmius tenuissimus TaxID=585030 RepID=A0ABR2ZAP1_9AGAR
MKSVTKFPWRTRVLCEPGALFSNQFIPLDIQNTARSILVEYDDFVKNNISPGQETIDFTNELSRTSGRGTNSVTRIGFALMFLDMLPLIVGSPNGSFTPPPVPSTRVLDSKAKSLLQYRELEKWPDLVLSAITALREYDTNPSRSEVSAEGSPGSSSGSLNGTMASRCLQHLKNIRNGSSDVHVETMCLNIEIISLNIHWLLLGHADFPTTGVQFKNIFKHMLQGQDIPTDNEFYKVSNLKSGLQTALALSPVAIFSEKINFSCSTDPQSTRLLQLWHYLGNQCPLGLHQIEMFMWRQFVRVDGVTYTALDALRCILAEVGHMLVTLDSASRYHFLPTSGEPSPATDSPLWSMIHHMSKPRGKPKNARTSSSKEAPSNAVEAAAFISVHPSDAPSLPSIGLDASQMSSDTSVSCANASSAGTGTLSDNPITAAPTHLHDGDASASAPSIPSEAVFIDLSGDDDAHSYSVFAQTTGFGISPSDALHLIKDFMLSLPSSLRVRKTVLLKRDLMRMGVGRWYNDMIINLFLSLTSFPPNCWVMDSLTWSNNTSKLSGRPNDSPPPPVMKANKTHFSSCDIALIPVNDNVDNHWRAVVVDRPRRLITLYDSMVGSYRKCDALLQTVKKWLSVMHVLCGLPVVEWEHSVNPNLRKFQTNSYDCGPFVIGNLLLHARSGGKHNHVLAQEFVPVIRAEVIHKLCMECESPPLVTSRSLQFASLPLPRVDPSTTPDPESVGDSRDSPPASTSDSVACQSLATNNSPVPVSDNSLPAVDAPKATATPPPPDAGTTTPSISVEMDYEEYRPSLSPRVDPSTTPNPDSVGDSRGSPPAFTSDSVAYRSLATNNSPVPVGDNFLPVVDAPKATDIPPPPDAGSTTPSISVEMDYEVYPSQHHLLSGAPGVQDDPMHCGSFTDEQQCEEIKQHKVGKTISPSSCSDDLRAIFLSNIMLPGYEQLGSVDGENLPDASSYNQFQSPVCVVSDATPVQLDVAEPPSSRAEEDVDASDKADTRDCADFEDARVDCSLGSPIVVQPRVLLEDATNDILFKPVDVDDSLPFPVSDLMLSDLSAAVTMEVDDSFEIQTSNCHPEIVMSVSPELDEAVPALRRSTRERKPVQIFIPETVASSTTTKATKKVVTSVPSRSIGRPVPQAASPERKFSKSHQDYLDTLKRANFEPVLKRPQRGGKVYHFTSYGGATEYWKPFFFNSKDHKRLDALVTASGTRHTVPDAWAKYPADDSVFSNPLTRDPSLVETNLFHKKCITPMTFSKFQETSAPELQNIFRATPIVISGVPKMMIDSKWDRPTVSQLGCLNTWRQVHDKSIDVEDDADDETIKTSLAVVLKVAENVNQCKLLNVMDVPGYGDFFNPTRLTTDVFASKHTRFLPLINDTSVSGFSWHLVSTKDVYSTFHMDAQGAAAMLMVEVGAKLVFLLVPTSRDISCMADIRYSRDVDLEVDGASTGPIGLSIGCEVQGVLLTPGDVLLIPPGVFHFVYTLEPTICNGRHFFCSSTIRQTCWALYHTLVYGFAITNEDHSKSRAVLVRLVGYWCQQFKTCGFDPADEDIGHSPKWSTMAGALDFLTVSNVLELGPTLWREQYESGVHSNEDLRELEMAKEWSRTLFDSYADTFSPHLTHKSDGLHVRSVDGTSRSLWMDLRISFLVQQMCCLVDHARDRKPTMKIAQAFEEYLPSQGNFGERVWKRFRQTRDKDIGSTLFPSLESHWTSYEWYYILNNADIPYIIGPDVS